MVLISFIWFSVVLVGFVLFHPLSSQGDLLIYICMGVGVWVSLCLESSLL